MSFDTKKINNWINGSEVEPSSDKWINKVNPHSGEVDCLIADSNQHDVDYAIDIAEDRFSEWAMRTPVDRGNILYNFVQEMINSTSFLAKCVARETGKSYKDSHGEVLGSIAQGQFFAGEGRRFYGRTLTSGVYRKYSQTVRTPLGVAGLIVPANTPIANIAWKIFPALICGNSIVLKASEDAPEIALIIARLSKKAGIPDGVFNVIQGTGSPAGSSIVKSKKVSVVSFTGSTHVGTIIATEVGRRMGRVSLELGGKNPFVVCDDANLDNAVEWASLSAFSNAGQRCASGSKILVFSNIYEKFKKLIIDKANNLKLGIGEDCDLGPVINQKQFQNILNSIDNASKEGGNIICGGRRSNKSELASGYYIEPTIIDGLSNDSDLVCSEIFGPVASLHPISSVDEAINITNNGEYGLTAAIHTNNIERAMNFAQSVRVGVVNINAGTYGSEPHMPFGGFGLSGNGTREPGVEALDVYSELKNISVLLDSADSK